MSTLLLTGGGSAGHVTPNIAIAEAMQARGWNVVYVGSKAGIERDLMQARGIPYTGIRTGKLRRYWSWQNFIDPFKIALGFFQALWAMFRLKPDVVFSKGGFVAVPVVLAAACFRKPILCHESDLTPGLATRISAPFAKTILTGFDKTAETMKKARWVGTPIRKDLLAGDPNAVLKHANKPVLLIMGGGLGSQLINNIIRAALPALTARYTVIHSCGKGKTDPTFDAVAGYQQFEYIDKGLSDILAASHIVISRAGANAITELWALKKPHILVPLSTKASRGDQVLNAAYMRAKGLSTVITEEDFDLTHLQAGLHDIESQYEKQQQRFSEYPLPDSVALICDEIASG